MVQPSEFFDAVKQGDFISVTCFLNEGHSADTTDDRGVTPLIYAAREGHLEVVRVLIEFGAEIDGRGDNQQLTPLQQAAWNDNLECARFLVLHGADVNADYDKRPGWSGLTPLMYALDEMASPDVARLLIKHGAAVNVRNQGGTALEIAASYGNQNLVELLKQAGAQE